MVRVAAVFRFIVGLGVLDLRVRAEGVSGFKFWGEALVFQVPLK